MFNYCLLISYGENKTRLQFNVQLIAKLNIISDKLRSLYTVADPGYLDI